MKVKKFKSIEIGGKSKTTLIDDLKARNIHFNEYAKILLSSSYFEIHSQNRFVDLVRVTPFDLGIEKKSTYSKIIQRAKELGLSLCPLYLGAFLRLNFLEQEPGPYITIASELPNNDRDYPNGFYVRNYEGKLWLRGYRSDDDYLWPVESEFIFICSSL